jgi:regulation of enolase protein 1 (concanavalin A-like superfamily)
MYVELIHFKRGSFVKREAPFFTSKAFTVYDKVVAKYSKLPDQEVLIALRNDNHTLVKACNNIKPMATAKERLAAAKGR